MYNDHDWLNTTQIAEHYGVTRITVGNWFRRGHIPATHSRRQPITHPNGVTIAEWQAPWDFLKSFIPPPKGPRHQVAKPKRRA